MISVQKNNKHMKNKLVLSSLTLFTLLILTGCIAIGTAQPAPKMTGGTLGQQLIDLKVAQSNGAISEAEYQSLKAKLIGTK